MAGHRPPVGSSAFQRESREGGFDQAVAALIPALDTELERFRERVKHDATVQVQHAPGGTRGGSLDLLALAFVGLLAVAHGRRR